MIQLNSSTGAQEKVAVKYDHYFSQANRSCYGPSTTIRRPKYRSSRAASGSSERSAMRPTALLPLRQDSTPLPQLKQSQHTLKTPCLSRFDINCCPLNGPHDTTIRTQRITINGQKIENSLGKTKKRAFLSFCSLDHAQSTNSLMRITTNN
jgi:hypothetical protein